MKTLTPPLTPVPSPAQSEPTLADLFRESGRIAMQIAAKLDRIREAEDERDRRILDRLHQMERTHGTNGLVSQDRARELLGGISVNKLHDLRYAGEIEWHDHMGRPFYVLSSLQAYIERHTRVS